MDSNPVEAPKTFVELNLRLLKSQSQLRWSHLHFICMSVVHIIFIRFIPFTCRMNSINWPTANVWVFIAQLVEHCSANAEAMDSNPVEAPKTFFGLNLRLLKSQLQLGWSHLHFICMSAVHIIFICFIPFTGTMISLNWPSPNVWAFIAQLEEHCSANTEAMGWNPVEAPQLFFRA